MSSSKDCIFCKIINKEIPAKIILENEGAISFLDVNPITNGHTLVIPKNHHTDLSSCNKQDLNYVIQLVHDVAYLLEGSKLKPWGFNYISNQGPIAGQEVLHLHFHIIPKYAKNEGIKFEKENIQIDPIEDVYDTLFKSIKDFNKY